MLETPTDTFDLFAFFTASVNTPFVVALGILLTLMVIEIATLVMGMPFSQKLDAILHLDLHGPELHAPDLHGPDQGGHGGLDLSHEPGMFGTAWDWLNAGRVPLLVLMMIMLAAFGSIGLMIEGVCHALVGWVPTTFAVIPALIATVPVTRQGSLLISKLVPRDETYAVDAGSLVGRTGIIITGPLASDTIARVKVKDAHGNHHFPWVRTKDPNLKLGNGDQVLLVEHAGETYLAIAADPKLTS